MDCRGFAAVVLRVEPSALAARSPSHPTLILHFDSHPGLHVVLLTIWPEWPHDSFSFVYPSCPSRRPAGFRQLLHGVGRRGQFGHQQSDAHERQVFKPENSLYKSGFGVRQTHALFKKQLYWDISYISLFTVLKCVTAVFHIFRELCKHHYDLISEKFHHPLKKPCIWEHILTPSFHSCVTMGNLLSFS